MTEKKKRGRPMLYGEKCVRLSVPASLVEKIKAFIIEHMGQKNG